MQIIIATLNTAISNAKKTSKNYFIVKVVLPGKFQYLAGTCGNLNEYTLFEIIGEKLKNDEDCNNTIIRDIRE